MIAFLLATAFNLGPFVGFEEEVTAIRPFWSHTAETEDALWPLGTWHSHSDGYWYRFAFLAHGHEGSFNFLPLWFSERDRKTDEFHWALFPIYGTHPHMFFMDDITFAMWPLYTDYCVKGVRSHAVMWPIVSWKDKPREALGIWPFYGDSKMRESEHRYALWPIVTWADYCEDRDTSGAGWSWMLWPLFGQVERERERQWLFLPPLFSRTTTDDAWRLRCPWPIVDLEFGARRDRWSVWPLVERQVQKRYADGETDDAIWRFGWQLVEKTKDRFNFFPFFTCDRNLNGREEDYFIRAWPFWSRSADHGREKVKVPDLIPVRNAEGFARNWEPFWSLYNSETLKDGRTRRHFLFNFFWWTSEE